LIEEFDRHVVEQRGIDSGYDILHILAIAFEQCPGEGGEDNACERRWMSGFSDSARSRGSELKVKFFEPSQCGQADDHRFGGNVSRMGNIPKGQKDKVSGGQK